MAWNKGVVIDFDQQGLTSATINDTGRATVMCGDGGSRTYAGAQSDKFHNYP
jgi:hypothetical protein